MEIMVGEVAVAKKLYNAATTGDLATFQQLLQQDPYLLDTVSFAYSRNLLHIATMRGQLSIVEEVLRINPRLALDLDSKNSSPLHIAAAQGSLEIARKLFAVAPETCWWRDCHEMNPVHIAAMNGHVEVLEELILMDPTPAMKRLHRGQTVLHLCIEHGQLAALKVLVEKLGILVYAKDDDGDYLLHVAARSKRFEALRYLVENRKTDTRVTNADGYPTTEILHRGPPDDATSEILTFLHNLPTRSWDERIPKMSEMTMVVVVLIATMAFQGAIAPPGGMWQDDASSHRAGEAVMASTHPKIYKHFVRANTIAFISSLVTIFLNTTWIGSSDHFIIGIARHAMWASLASIAVSYGASLKMTIPTAKISIDHVVIAVVAVYVGTFMLILFLYKIEWAHLLWKDKIFWREDLSNESRPRRLVYWVFRRWETAATWFEVVIARWL